MKITWKYSAKVGNRGHEIEGEIEVCHTPDAMNDETLAIGEAEEAASNEAADIMGADIGGVNVSPKYPDAYPFN